MVLGGASGQQVSAVIDTGFSGYLTLPSGIIAALNLTWLGREQGFLADGSINLFDVYRAIISWDGHHRSIEVDEANTQPLLGMALLERHSLRMNIVNGGSVEITPLSQP